MRLVVRALLSVIAITYVTAAYAAVTVSVNGVSHTIPQTGEKGWGTNVTAWIQAISANTLQPSGGNFTLTADTNFGGTYGLVSPYYKSRATNVSSSGAVRIGTTEAIGWRNNANSGNVLLSINGSNQLLFDGALLPTLAASDFTDSGFTISDNLDATKKIAFQAAGIGTTTTRTLTVPDASGTLVLADASQTLTGKSLDGDDNTLTDISNSAIKASAGIVYSKLSIASGDIALAKLATVTSDRALRSSGAGVIEPSSVTATEQGYLSGVTSAIQTQLDARVAKSTYSAKGALAVGTGASTVGTQTVGADGLFLKADSGQTNGVTWASPAGAGLAVTSKTTTYTAQTSDDVILASTAGGAYTITLYAASGNTGKVLRIKKTTSDFTVLTIDGNASETIDGQPNTTLNTQYEEVTIVCDGSNWYVLDRVVPKAAGTYTPTFVGLGTATSISFSYKRLGPFLRIWGVWANGTVNGSNSSFSLPTGLTADNSEIIPVGIGYRGTNTGSSVKSMTGFLAAASATIVSLSVLDTSAAISPMAVCPGTTCFATGAGQYIDVTVPIAGWN